MSRPNCDFNPNFTELKKVYKKWMKNKHITKNMLDPDEVFYGLVQSEFKVPLEILKFKKDITKGDIRGFKKRLENVADAAEGGYLGNKFASLFYTPEAFSKKDPMVGKLMDKYLQTSYFYKGHDQKSKNSQQILNEHLKLEMKELDLIDNAVMRTGKKLTRKTALSQLRKLEEEMRALAVESHNGNKTAFEAYRKLERQQEQLIADSELQVYAQFIGYIEKGMPKLIKSKIKDAQQRREEAKKLYPKDKSKWPTVPEWKVRPASKRKKPFLTREDLGKLTDKDGERISTHMVNALEEYIGITDELYWTLKNGVDAYIETIKLGQKGKTEKQILDFAESLKEKLMPNMEKGFFPHFSRDLNIDMMDGLMGKLEDLVLASNKYLQSNVSLADALDNIQGYVSQHTKGRTQVSPESMKYSLDFPAVIAQYSENVNRFNYINTINKNTREVINRLESTYKKGKYASGYGESVSEFLMDLHKAATGFHEVKNPNTSAWIRTMLGMEFITKIGFNPRSAVRNFSQSLLNAVHWSPIQIKQARDFIKKKGMDKQIKEDLEEAGILFAEARELEESINQAPGNYTSIRYNRESGKLEHVPVTMIEKALNATNKLAAKSGVMHAKVENKNRTWTYKISYSEMYRYLQHPEFGSNYIKRKGLDPKKDNSKIIESARNRYAKEYALNMTTTLHFDYSKFSKAKVMREGPGAMIFQFQHYGFKFFERNMEYSRKAKNDLMELEFGGTNAWRAYRMALAYFAVPLMASSVTGIDFGSIVEHDTSERLMDLSVAFIGDEEERKKAFHGKGPIVGTIGFPIYSDLINIGMMTNLINLDDDNLLVLLAGLQDSHDLRDNADSYQQLRLINSFLARGVYRHLPQLAEGNIGWVLQSELGMYPTKLAQERQQFLKDFRGSKELFQSLDQLERMGR